MHLCILKILILKKVAGIRSSTMIEVYDVGRVHGLGHWIPAFAGMTVCERNDGGWFGMTVDGRNGGLRAGMTD